MQLLEQHFDAAFAAPDGIKKLRELILTLAMQGKLVEQDPSDQPASELLKEIEQEKRRLVAAGKIKVPKSLPAVESDEVPYELPRNWSWARIRSISFDWGQKIPDGEFLYIDVGSVDNATAEISENLNRVSHSEASSRARKIVHKGTLIYSTIRPYLKNIAIIRNDYDIDLIASTAFAVMHPFSGIDGGFLRYVLLSDYLDKSVNALAKGVAYPAIAESDFFSQLIPIPPRAEQRRIVARIDELMARCDALEALRAEREQKRLDAHTAALNALLSAQEPAAFAEAWQFMTQHFSDLHSVPKNVAELRKAVLQLAVMGKLVEQDPNDPPASELLREIQEEKNRLIVAGKIRAPKPLPPVTPEEMPYPVPEGWEWVRVWDIAELITSGSRDWSQYLSESGAIFVTMGNLSRGSYQLRLDNMRYVNPPRSGEGTRTRLQENDLIISITGDVGNLGLIPNNFGEAYINQHSCVLRVIKQVRNRYFAEYMRTPIAKFQFDAPQRGIKNSFRLGDVGEMVFPLPPLPEQRRIVAKIDQLMVLCDQLEVGLAAQTGMQSALLSSIMAAVTPASADPTRRAAPVIAPAVALAGKTVRRGPGRPRKEPLEASSIGDEVLSVRRGPGRPRKVQPAPAQPIPTAASEDDAIRRIEALKLERAQGTRQVSLFDQEN